MARRIPAVLGLRYRGHDSVGHSDHAGSNRVPHLCGGAKQDKGERSRVWVGLPGERSRPFLRVFVDAHQALWSRGVSVQIFL
jgi:hypothetical protein